jgi:hypothetical protein
MYRLREGFLSLKSAYWAARLADKIRNHKPLKNDPEIKKRFSKILDVAAKLADENPLHSGYLEPSIPLAAIVKGSQAARKFKERIGDTKVKQGEAQGSNIARMALHQEASKLFAEAGAKQKLEESKMAIRQAVQQAEEEVEFKTITSSTKISRESIIGPYKTKLSSMSPRETLLWLARDYSGLPGRSVVDKATTSGMSKAVGLQIASVVPLESSLPKGLLEDDESKIQFKVDQNLNIGAQGI